MLSNHLISAVPFSFCLQSFPASGSFPNEVSPWIRWPKYWSFIFSISPSNEYSGLISFRIGWFDLAVQGNLQESSPALNSEASQEAVTKTIPKKKKCKNAKTTKKGCLRRLYKQLRNEEKRKAREKEKDIRILLGFCLKSKNLTLKLHMNSVFYFINPLHIKIVISSLKQKSDIPGRCVMLIPWTWICHLVVPS